MTDPSPGALPSRRRFLAGTLAAAGVALLDPLALAAAQARGRALPPGDLFPLGVAAGDPDATSVILWTRLISPDPGTPLGAAGASGASMLLGGTLAGGPTMAFLVVLAGGLLDAAAAWGERLRLPAWLLVPLLGLAGLAANLLCMVKRLFSPSYEPHVVLGLTGLAAVIMSYALFGLIGGLGGALIGCLIRKKS